MPQYLVGVYHDDSARLRSPEQMAPIHAAVSAVNQEAIDAGIFVFAGGLHESSMATTINPKSGTPVLTDGPYVESKEYMGGFWIIDVADLDVALDWSKRFAIACDDVLVVRPFMEGPPKGAE